MDSSNHINNSYCQPSVAVILPTFRPGKYIQRIINSIATQSKSLVNDGIPVKLFIILNGEKMPFYEDLLSYLKPLELDWELLYSMTPSVSEARNIGLDRSKSFEYIIFVDDDDDLSENYLAELLIHARKSVGSSDFIIQSDTILVLPDGHESHNHYVSRAIHKISPLSEQKFSPLTHRKFLNSVCGKLFSQSLVREIRFDKNLKISEDALFLFSLSRKLDTIYFATDAQYRIFCRINSSSRVKKPLRQLVKEALAFVNRLTMEFVKHPFQYSFRLYASRVVASIKFLGQRICSIYSSSNTSSL